MEGVQRLIDETKGWLEANRQAGPKRQIEALACRIRIRALEDALRVMGKCDNATP